ncbi:MAG: GIY-YIG nuclease family protein [Candidatus Theseobacter exili]|nr:GIY-YIG nuclease family protein [Candidatus Theseobacter exili]
MDTRHKERMEAIGDVALPPKGTQSRILLDRILEKRSSPEQKKIIKNLWKKAYAIVSCQQLNGAGHETDQTLRYFQAEYNNRIWAHGLRSIPSTFNVAEAFFQYDPMLNAVILHEEQNYLFSIVDFVNWYTSQDIDFNLLIALESLSPGIIYTDDTLFDPADLLYGIEKGAEIGVVGFAMVRFGTEISILCIAGETGNLIKKTKEIKRIISTGNPVQGRENIRPDPDLILEAVPLKSKTPLWRLIALTRFDLKDMSQSVRYVCHDIGTSFFIETDDPATFLDMNGMFIKKEIEEHARQSNEKIRGYNSLFDLCSTSLFLPLYFETFSEDVVLERFRTDYANEMKKVSLQNIKKHAPHAIKQPYRVVSVLRGSETLTDVSATIYSIPNFHVETTGYWRNLEPGKVGTDRSGNPIHGRTWVSKKLSWMEADEPKALVAQKGPKKIIPVGPAPGFIYVMRSPVHARNVFKVGLTKRTTRERANDLSSATGVPGKIYVMNEWAVGDCISVEKAIHKQLAEYRVDPRREFFEAPLEHIVSVIEKNIQEYDAKKHK